ncbi:hypothetical protein KIPB_002267 [Kipferlia bialata]|uniref:Uncharacterized protein n=1 Tax=Kipferlia bialata TaxID=797122 RepID=A0A9K3CSF7_9EUKA|nr:hypothetical protein KIPB_002267 [Kipferlia bialata]|eukprot:g2267.t1
MVHTEGDEVVGVDDGNAEVAADADEERERERETEPQMQAPSLSARQIRRIKRSFTEADVLTYAKGEIALGVAAYGRGPGGIFDLSEREYESLKTYIYAGVEVSRRTQRK